MKYYPYDWAIERNIAPYNPDLLFSTISVSVNTADIINNLPELEF